MDLRADEELLAAGTAREVCLRCARCAGAARGGAGDGTSRSLPAWRSEALQGPAAVAYAAQECRAFEPPHVLLPRAQRARSSCRPRACPPAPRLPKAPASPACPCSTLFPPLLPPPAPVQVVNRVQRLRKKAGLVAGDTVEVFYAPKAGAQQQQQQGQEGQQQDPLAAVLASQVGVGWGWGVGDNVETPGCPAVSALSVLPHPVPGWLLAASPALPALTARIFPAPHACGSCRPTTSAARSACPSCRPPASRRTRW